MPDAAGALTPYRLSAPGHWSRPTAPITSRKVYAAAHVVPLMKADNVPGAPALLDWDATLGFRHELWSWGLGVADAMDTAQRGMGLDWAATQELIRRSAGEATAVVRSGNPALAGKSVRDLLSCGVGTDQLDLENVPSGAQGLEEVTHAYLEQLAVVEESGAKVILMCSRALARTATGPDDYLKVYSRMLTEASQPVVLHWLGPMFDPALQGYWGSADTAEATATFLTLIRAHADKVDGVKVSLLDAAHEV
ncbi:MAG TPA: DUF993 family protein, partial [Arthrobacter sp.]|nr:DUF993 family protein [Arthrobacter sp.]